MQFDSSNLANLNQRLNPLAPRPRPAGSPLAETAFASNPGNLKMFSFVPPKLEAGAPLVVILHGCGQSAAGYDLGTGWSALAHEQGFAVLAAEQKAVNNPGTCFDWFNPEDIARGQGEAASIAAMIETMVATHRLDPARIFITGLSAGGAMTAVMLATYPELFAGCAIIAGLPFGAAANVREALEAMRAAPLKTPQAWGDLVRAAAPAPKSFPRVSIWHGDLDTTVALDNAKASAAQWVDVQGLALTDAKQDTLDGAVRLSWGNSLEVITVAGMGHGTPIDASDLGAPAPFILDVGISSTRRIAQFWGLAQPAAASVAKPRPKPAPIPVPSPILPQIETVIVPLHPPLAQLQESLLRKALKRLLKTR